MARKGTQELAPKTQAASSSYMPSFPPSLSKQKGEPTCYRFHLRKRVRCGPNLVPEHLEVFEALWKRRREELFSHPTSSLASDLLSSSRHDLSIRDPGRKRSRARFPDFEERISRRGRKNYFLPRKSWDEKEYFPLSRPPDHLPLPRKKTD